MSADPTPVFDDVINRLRTQQPLPVFEDEVPEDTDLEVVNGVFRPFIVIYSGGPIRAGSDHHLVSSKYDTTILYWTMEVYAPVASDAKRICGSLIPIFAAYRPVNSGEMMLEGGMTYSRASNTVRPTQYIKSIGWSARSNLSWV